MLLQEMTWPEIGDLALDIPVVVPAAALEQHGHHMPVSTDSLLVGEVVRRVGAAMSDRVLIAPLLLGQRQPERRPPRPRAVADGARLRVGDVDDAAAGPAPGEGRYAGRAGRLRVRLRAGLSRSGPRRTAR